MRRFDLGRIARRIVEYRSNFEQSPTWISRRRHRADHMHLRQTAYISLAFVLERFRFDFQNLYRYLNLSWKISSTIPNVHFPRFRSSEAMITTSPIDSVDGLPRCFKLCLFGKARRYSVLHPFHVLLYTF